MEDLVGFVQLREVAFDLVSNCARLMMLLEVRLVTFFWAFHFWDDKGFKVCINHSGLDRNSDNS